MDKGLDIAVDNVSIEGEIKEGADNAEAIEEPTTVEIAAIEGPTVDEIEEESATEEAAIDEDTTVGAAIEEPIIEEVDVEDVTDRAAADGLIGEDPAIEETPLFTHKSFASEHPDPEESPRKTRRAGRNGNK